MVIEYVASLLEMAVGMAAFRGKLKFEDFVWQVGEVSLEILTPLIKVSFCCLQEPYKLERLKELLEQNEEIKKARKVDLDKSDLAALGSRTKDPRDGLDNGI